MGGSGVGIPDTYPPVLTSGGGYRSGRCTSCWNAFLFGMLSICITDIFFNRSYYCLINVFISVCHSVQGDVWETAPRHITPPETPPAHIHPSKHTPRADTPQQMATAADGTRPAGMRSCFCGINGQ